MKRRLIAMITSLSMIFSYITPISALQKGKITLSESNLTKEQIGTKSNAMSDEMYNEFGLTLNDPTQFTDENIKDPLDGYEPIALSELQLGWMNRYNSFTGEFSVLDNPKTMSDSDLNVDNMKKVGKAVSYPYETNNKNKEVCTTNSCAADFDGDGKDELVNITLYVDRTSSPNYSKADIYAYKYDGTNYLKGNTITYQLTDSSSDDKTYVWSMEADTSKAYTAMTSGDFDGDGKDELAVYIAQDNTPFIKIFDGTCDSEGCKLSESSTIYLSKIASWLAFRYKSRYYPIVSLSTTSI